MSTFADYTLVLSSDASVYGSECSTESAKDLTAALAKRMAAKYPGLQVRIDPAITVARATGPDAATAEEITRVARE